MARSGLREELERLTFCVSGKRITPAVQKGLLARMSGMAQSAAESTVGEGLEKQLEAQLERWMRVFVLRQSAEEEAAVPARGDGWIFACAPSRCAGLER
ncbi:MAG: hypothetical protein IPH37_16695 [Burkholderiales bacterium]|nr:hypothetical protein [Burkholderiales bacterium]